MLKTIATHFGVGLATLLPFAFVIWVLVGIFQFVDNLLGPTVDQVIGMHVPGVGFILVVIGTTLVGALTKVYMTHRMLQWAERLFNRIPFVKSLYSTIKELIQNLVGQRRGFQRAVLIQWPDERAQVLGLVTHENLPPEIDPTGAKIAVYLPNTFQFAGITVLVERSRVTDCDLSVEDAFKFSISAGLGQSVLEWTGED